MAKSVLHINVVDTRVYGSEGSLAVDIKPLLDVGDKFFGVFHYVTIYGYRGQGIEAPIFSRPLHKLTALSFPLGTGAQCPFSDVIKNAILAGEVFLNSQREMGSDPAVLLNLFVSNAKFSKTPHLELMIAGLNGRREWMVDTARVVASMNIGRQMARRMTMSMKRLSLLG